jgi:hypothetical protein
VWEVVTIFGSLKNQDSPYILTIPWLWIRDIKAFKNNIKIASFPRRKLKNLPLPSKKNVKTESWPARGSSMSMSSAELNVSKLLPIDIETGAKDLV